MKELKPHKSLPSFQEAFGELLSSQEQQCSGCTSTDSEELKGSCSRKAKWSMREDQALMQLYMKFGPNWAQIGSKMNARDCNSIRNRFYSTAKKQVKEYRQRTNRGLVNSGWIEKEENQDPLVLLMKDINQDPSKLTELEKKIQLNRLVQQKRVIEKCLFYGRQRLNKLIQSLHCKK